MVTCLLRESVSLSLGVFLVMVDPAPIVEPSAMVTGATNCVSDPTNTSSPIVVECLFAPS